MKISKKTPLCDLAQEGVIATFGPLLNPEQFKIDLIEEATRRSLIKREYFSVLEVEVGHRLEEEPYSEKGFSTRGMPNHYLYEGSIWLNVFHPNGSVGNISLVPHFHDTYSSVTDPPHHNFWLRWTHFNGRKGSDNQIDGHKISVNIPVIMKVTYGKNEYKGKMEAKKTQ